jgi:urease gamma subunit
MGLVVAFVAGCVVGARVAGETFSDVMVSARAVRDSEEFHDLVAAVRSHAGQTLHRIAELMETGSGASGPQDVVDQVKNLIGASDLFRAARGDEP